MTITDPLDALQKQFESEDRSSDPVLGCLADLASELNLLWPASKAVGSIVAHLTANRIERIQLMLNAIRDELRRHEDALDAMRRGTSQPRFDEWFALVLDGLKKAEQTRAKERVQRIGKILARSLVHVPSPSADDVEEMMRTAMELSDRDASLLSELVRVQGDIVKTTGRIDRYGAWQLWEHGSWPTGFGCEIDSVFSKLESFGLVSRLAPPNNLNIMADFQNRYALLKKGLDFSRAVQKEQDK